MGAYRRDRTDAVASPINVRGEGRPSEGPPGEVSPPKNVMKFTFRGSRSKDNNTLDVVHRKVYIGRHTQFGDSCIGHLPMRKSEGNTKSLKPGKRERTEANVLS